MQDKGEKMPLYEGADGKLYYNFALGLKVQMHGSDCDRNEEYTLEIVGCHYIGNTEYYDVEQFGKRTPQPYSANRVKYLVSRYGVKTLESGERSELPLLPEEVRLYYRVKEREKELAISEADKLEEYAALNTAVKALQIKIGYARAFENYDEAAALEKQEIEYIRRAVSVLKAYGIDPALVNSPPCPRCDGRGVIGNAICNCAIKRTEEIKAFNAAERLRLRQLTK